MIRNSRTLNYSPLASSGRDATLSRSRKHHKWFLPRSVEMKITMPLLASITGLNVGHVQRHSRSVGGDTHRRGILNGEDVAAGRLGPGSCPGRFYHLMHGHCVI